MKNGLQLKMQHETAAKAISPMVLQIIGARLK